MEIEPGFGNLETFLRSLVGRDFEQADIRGPLKRIRVMSYPDSTYRCLTFRLGWIATQDESGQWTKTRIPMTDKEQEEGIDPFSLFGIEYLRVEKMSDGGYILGTGGTLPPVIIHPPGVSLQL